MPKETQQPFKERYRVSILVAFWLYYLIVGPLLIALAANFKIAFAAYGLLVAHPLLLIFMAFKGPRLGP